MLNRSRVEIFLTYRSYLQPAVLLQVRIYAYKTCRGTYLQKTHFEKYEFYVLRKKARVQTFLLSSLDSTSCVLDDAML